MHPFGHHGYTQPPSCPHECARQAPAKRLRPALQLRTRLPATCGNGTCVAHGGTTQREQHVLPVSLLRVRVNKARLVSLGSWLRGEMSAPGNTSCASCVWTRVCGLVCVDSTGARSLHMHCASGCACWVARRYTGPYGGPHKPYTAHCRLCTAQLCNLTLDATGARSAN
jgi:hypothetical protein